MAFCRLLIVLVLILNSGGSLGAEVKSFIVGGADAGKGAWPWMAYIKLINEEDTWTCGGTILNNLWVMTTAHCLTKYPEFNWQKSMVWVGTHSLTKGSVKYLGIINKMPHPEFRALSNGYLNDIGLLKLKKKVEFQELVKPVKLPTVDDTFTATSECWITGWGNVGTNNPLPNPQTLQQLKVSIISSGVCKARYPELTSNMLCAGDMGGGKDACNGDYGGPLVCRSGKDFVQVGIMSYGSADGCGLPDRPGVYTQVSKYLDFINAYINLNEEASAEV